jgi:hypothetical protein
LSSDRLRPLPLINSDRLPLRKPLLMLRKDKMISLLRPLLLLRKE